MRLITSFKTRRPRPLAVVAHADPRYAAFRERLLRLEGYDVLTAVSGPQARRLARRRGVALVVLEADLPDESGWLTCAKLKSERPAVRVVLVAEEPTAEARALAAFVGADSLDARAPAAVPA